MLKKEYGEISGIKYLIFLPNVAYEVPVMFFLSGLKYYINSFEEKLEIGILFSEFLKETNKLFALCCIDGNDSWYCNNFDGNIYWEDIFITKFLRELFKKYPISPLSVGISGFSMGGWGALRLGLRYSNIFHVVCGHSSSLRFENEMTEELISQREDFKKSFGNVFYYMQLHPVNYLYTSNHSKQVLWLDCGKNDHHINDNLHFISIAKDFFENMEFHIWPGNHSVKYWKSKMPIYFNFYADSLYFIKKHLIDD